MITKNSNEKIAFEKNKSNKFIVVKRFLTEIDHLSPKGKALLNLLGKASGNIEKFRSIIKSYRNYLKIKKAKDLLKVKKANISKNRKNIKKLPQTKRTVNYIRNSRNKFLKSKNFKNKSRVRHNFQRYTIKNWNYGVRLHKTSSKQFKNIQVPFIGNL